ncbi:hypothetical protein AB6A40_002327 [Gnathostoma spinigerum]|uniref:Dehydrogenase/reductase SDR family member 1 n=1 Tax=Gnathostoma spinigerum TaxID=75299 RepID=A0ABD6E6F8_9BILA
MVRIGLQLFARCSIFSSNTLSQRFINVGSAMFTAVSSSASTSMSRPLNGKVALVTGASRGLGRGIALQLGEAGATVYVTGREPSKSLSAEDKDLPSLLDTVKEIENRGGHAVPLYCDHSNEEETKKAFDEISRQSNNTLDILVNSAYSGAPGIKRNAGKKFFESDPLFWDEINNVGLRNVYICSCYAARLMVPKRSGLIVHISSAGAIQYCFNVPYGVGKAAIDRMAADMALELKTYGITVVSLWPGTVRTEISLKLADSGELGQVTGLSEDFVKRAVENGETPEFAGKATVALAADQNVFKKTGHTLLTADLSSEYGFTDVDGQTPSNMRSVSAALDFFGWPGLASVIPSWFKVPCWALHMSSYKF